MKLRVNGGITPALHAWLVQFLQEWPFLIWDGAFAAPVDLTQDQLAPLTLTHASVSDAFQALTRHDFQMAVLFNQQYNKEWWQNSGVTDMSLSADLNRLLQSIQPVVPPLPVVLPSMPSAVPLVPPLPRSILAIKGAEHAQSKNAVCTGSILAEQTAPSASHIFTQPNSATFNIQHELAAAQSMGCKTLLQFAETLTAACNKKAANAISTGSIVDERTAPSATSGSTSLEDDPELAADIVSAAAAAKAEETAKHDAELAASVAAEDARAALYVCLQPPSAALIAAAASEEVKTATHTADDDAEKAAIAMVAAPTPNFRDIWQLLSAFEARFAQMKILSVEGDDLETAIFVKKAMVIVDQLKKMKTPSVETIVAELKPYDTLIGEDLQTFLLSLMPVSPTQEEVVLALLGDLSAELEQEKKRAVSSDDLEAALAIKHAATVVARLQSHPSSAKDVLIALDAHMQVISKEWHARMHSLVPSTNLACGSPSTSSHRSR